MSLPSDEPQSPLPIGDLPKTLHGLPGITDAGAFLQEDLLGTCGTDVAVGTAAELFRTFNQPPFTMFSFVYRGQSSRWRLMPTLERLLWGTRPVKAGEQVERELVQQFRRHLHHLHRSPAGPRERPGNSRPDAAPRCTESVARWQQITLRGRVLCGSRGYRGRLCSLGDQRRHT